MVAERLVSRLFAYSLHARQCLSPQEARCQGEWKRWQEADKWAWDEVERQRWAEVLWRNQQRRRLDHAALRRNAAATEAKQRLEVCSGMPQASAPQIAGTFDGEEL